MSVDRFFSASLIKIFNDFSELSIIFCVEEKVFFEVWSNAPNLKFLEQKSIFFLLS